jgi:HD-GYP domain-containing protein (c-di-GMP phosphodiesterase class II)
MHPSYIPDTLSDQVIPPGLLHEEEIWNIVPNLILKEDSAEALLSVQRYTEGHLKKILTEVGFNPDIENKGRLTGHNTRVAILALLIADGMEDQGVDFPVDKEILAAAGLWHDTGKFHQTVHDSIYPCDRKIGPNDPAREIIKTHPKKGSIIPPLTTEMFTPEIRKKISDIIYAHHERYDGNGYYGIPNKEIPNEAWLIITADPTDVMLGTRGYNRQKTLTEVLKELEVCSGSQFHPTVTRSAIKTFSGQENLINHIRKYRHLY